jgi:hypothetical protein
MADKGSNSRESQVLNKHEPLSTSSSNRMQLPRNLSHVHVHSSVSSIESAGAKNVHQSEHPLSTNLHSAAAAAAAATTTTTATTTDSEYESEHDNNHNHSVKSLNLPQSLPISPAMPQQASVVSKIGKSMEPMSRRVKNFRKLFKSELNDEMPELIDTYVCAYQGQSNDEPYADN